MANLLLEAGAKKASAVAAAVAFAVAAVEEASEEVIMETPGTLAELQV